MQFFYDLGIQGAVYWGCYVLGFVAIFIFNAFYGKKYDIPRGRAVIFTIVSYALIYIWAYLLAWVINGFEWGHHNAIRVYIWMPVLLLLTGKMFSVDWKRACDYIAPSTCIVYGIARLGCNATGCCYGIPATWGIYSVEAGHRCFPVQLCEALTSLLIAVIILLLAKRWNYDRSGKLYPIMLILYGGTRFIWEFFADKERVFLNVTELGLWAFATFVIGMVWMIVIAVRRGKKQA